MSQISTTRLHEQARAALRSASEAVRTGQYASARAEAEAAADAYEALAFVERNPYRSAAWRDLSASAAAMATWAQGRANTTLARGA